MNDSAKKKAAMESETTETVVNEKPQIEDRVFKTAIACFQEELLPYLEIFEEVCSAAPTEVIHMELRQMYQDFNYVAKSGEWLHFEFVSGDITRKVMRTFRRYEAVTSCAFDVPITTYVVYTGKTKSPCSELTEGINTYKVKVVQMKGRNADELFTELEQKQQTSRIEKKDLLAVILAPLMTGEMSIKERIMRGIELLRRYSGEVDKEEYMRLEAMLYALATKFLDDVDMKDVVEGLQMTKLGELLMEKGMEKGMEIAVNALSDSILEMLTRHGDIPSGLECKIMEEKDMEVLKRWLKLAVECMSLEEFSKKM